jgi:predicted DNA-binding transcriptional regulator AlpA
MNTATIRVLGRKASPIVRIGTAGELLGVTRSTAYRMAQADEQPWPLVGPSSSRWVLLIPLLERYGIPYAVETDEAAAGCSCVGSQS